MVKLFHSKTTPLAKRRTTQHTGCEARRGREYGYGLVHENDVCMKNKKTPNVD